MRSALPPEPTYRAVNKSRETVLADRVEWAGSSASRRRGLLGRDGLPPGSGLYITPCEWIHTFGMRFLIDVVFLSRSGEVLKTYNGLKPNRISRIVWRADGVLELPQGALKLSKTEPGDIVEWLDSH